jgi:hypothetical protein
MNDYSVPTAYGFRDVLVKGFVDEVAIICGADEIARHSRIYDRGQFVFDPKHYLALREFIQVLRLLEAFPEAIVVAARRRTPFVLARSALTMCEQNLWRRRTGRGSQCHYAFLPETRTA